MYPKLSVIIPAFNEGSYIIDLINVVKQAQNVGEIVLVDDYSKPEFSDIYQNVQGITLIRHSENKGKDIAIQSGINNSKHDYILTLDADLKNITSKQIEYLNKYLPKFELVAIIRGGDYKWAKLIGNTYLTLGEHLIKKSLIEKYYSRLFNGKKWNFDNELNLIMSELGRNKAKYVEFKDTIHQMKSKKLGFFAGLKSDIKMIYDVHISRYKVFGAIIILLKLYPFRKDKDII